MKIEVADILDNLKALKTCKNPDSLIGSDCVTFTGEFMFTASMNMVAAVRFESDFQATVPLDKMIVMLDRHKNKKLTIKTEGDRLGIKGKGANINLTTVQDIQTQDIFDSCIAQTSKDNEYDIPEGFWDGLAVCQQTASTNENDQTAICVKVDGQYIYSTDKSKASCYDLGEDSGISLLLRAKLIPKLLHFKKEFSTVSFADKWISFWSDENGFLVAMRNMHGKYSKIVIETMMNTKGKRIKIPEEMEQSLTVVKEVMDSEDNGMVDIHLEGKEMNIVGEGEYGKINETLELKYKVVEPIHVRASVLNFLFCIQKGHTNFIVGENRIIMSSKKTKHMIPFILGE
jgi:hypothetical protein